MEQPELFGGTVTAHSKSICSKLQQTITKIEGFPYKKNKVVARLLLPVHMVVIIGCRQVVARLWQGCINPEFETVTTL